MIRRADILRSLKLTEHQFRTIFYRAGIGIALTNTQGEILESNLAFREFIGYDGEDLVGMSSAEITHPDDLATDLQYLTELMAGERNSYEMEKRYIRRDGAVVWGRLTASIVFDSRDEPLFVIGMVEDITLRKDAEEQLRRSRKQLQDIIDSAFTPLYVKDLEGHLIVVSQAISDLLGIPKDELLGKTPYDLYPRDIADAHSANDRMVLQTGSACESEETVPSPTHTRTLLSLKFPLRDVDGSIYAVAGISTDITDRKLAETHLEALLEDNERQRRLLQQLVDASAIGIAVVSGPDHRYELTNPAYRAIPGMPDTPMLRRTMAEVFPNVPGATDLTEMTYRTGESQHVREYEADVGPGREHTYWDVDCIPLKDPEGSVESVLILTHEVTDQVLARIRIEELANQADYRRAELEAVLDAVPMAVWIAHDPKCQYITGNRTANHFYEAEEGENVSANMSEARRFFRDGKELAPEDLPMQYAVAHNIEVKDAEFEVQMPSGTSRILWGYATPTHDTEGEVRGCIAAFADISERKQAEAALQHQVKLLQRALLPDCPPSIPGYSIASAYVPAFAGEEIGGDFYDVFMTEDGKVGIVIGDVSGKGIEAAALAATTRSTIAAFAYDTSSPGEALSHANALLVAKLCDSCQFVTAFLAVLDPDTGDISYSSAGHPPPIVLEPDGGARLLEITNVPLGVMGGNHYTQAASTLQPGDKVVLYTDGVVEARHGPALFGVEGVMEVLRVHGACGPDELVAEILGAAGDWAEEHLRDDTALVIVKRETNP